MLDHPLLPQVIAELRSIFDPEIPVNIYDLNLIYEIEIDEDNFVKIQMTLTSPGCPVAQTFPGMVQDRVMNVDGVSGASVELVWEPPWSKDNLSDEVKLQLGML